MRITYQIDYDAIERHVCQQLAAASVKEDPYPHVQVDNLLPDAYYDLLLDALPLPQDIGVDNNAALNFAVSEHDPAFTQMTTARRELWVNFETRVNQAIIRRGMVQLFTPYLKMKCDVTLDGEWPARAEALLGQEWQRAFARGEVYQPEHGAGGGSGGRLLLYTRDFNLPPHVDNTASLLTYLLYLPRDNKREHLGTTMHTVTDAQQLSEQYRALKSLDVWFPDVANLTEESITFPYRRNSLAAMLCLPTAVHSAQFQQLDFCRYAMQTQVLLRDDIANVLFQGWTAKHSQQHY